EFVRKNRTLNCFKELKSFLRRNPDAKPLVRANFYRSFDSTIKPEIELEDISISDIENLIKLCINSKSTLSGTVKKILEDLMDIIQSDLQVQEKFNSFSERVMQPTILFEEEMEI